MRLTDSTGSPSQALLRQREVPEGGAAMLCPSTLRESRQLKRGDERLWPGTLDLRSPQGLLNSQQPGMLTDTRSSWLIIYPLIEP